MPERLDLRHGMYRIIAGRLKEACVARAYLGGTRLHEAGGPSVEAAVESVRRWLNEQDGAEIARRKDGTPTVEAYRRAFTHLRLGSHHRAMLMAHARAQARTMTAGALAAAAGYANFATANLHYGRLGRMIGEFIGYTPKERHGDGEPVWTFVLATGGRAGGDLWCWRMRPELAEALESLGLA